MKKIKEARIKYNLTQHQMSELTGVPFRTIQNWEGGQRECPRYVRNLVIEKLDRIFGTSDSCPKCVEKQSEGEWIENEDDFWIQCSACKVELLDEYDIMKTPYCPHCGAKMKGGEEECE